jgi:hypothetical protein
MNVDREIEQLKKMTIGELRRKHEEVFGEPARTGNKAFLWKRIGWRIQELAFGGLSERAKRRAEELANDADLRIRPPRQTFVSAASSQGGQTVAREIGPTTDNRLPAPGTILTRMHQGRRVEVKVLDRGFEFQGRTFRSLSAAATAAAGSHWNGFAFFGLETRRGAE